MIGSDGIHPAYEHQAPPVGSIHDTLAVITPLLPSTAVHNSRITPGNIQQQDCRSRYHCTGDMPDSIALKERKI